MPWVLDPAHSTVEFSAKHMMISTVRGQFTAFNVVADINPDNLTLSSVTATIDAASLETRNEQRNGHLKSADFLHAEEHPQLVFTSNKIEHVGGDKYKIYGDLSVRGVSKPVVLDTTFEGVQTSPWGTQVAGFSADTTINRKDWGLNWNVALETGGVLVSEKVNIHLEIELIKQEAAVPAEAATA